MFKHLYSVFCFINIVTFVHCEGIYTVVAPEILSSFFNYNVAVTVHAAKGPCEIEVGITARTFNISKIINILPMSTKIVEFEMPKLEFDYYMLTVKGVSGIIFEKSTDIYLKPNNPLVFIQTDKPIYKPGDLVQYRIVFLNEKTQPVQLKKPMNVIIKDGDYNSVQLVNNINPIHGVYTDSFQLSDHHMSDFWHIEVHDDKTKLQEKSFGVTKYDLPTFKTFLDVPADVAFTDEVIRITVRSRYYYGRPVKGKASVTVEFRSNKAGSRVHPESRAKISKTFSINGKGHVEFNIWNDLPRPEMAFKSEHFPFNYLVYAHVEEELTGNKISPKNSTFKLHEHNVVIKAPIFGLSYNPGKLTTYTVVGQKLDGSPIQDTTNTVELNIGELVFYSTFNENGTATFKFVLPDGYREHIYCKYLGIKEYVGQIFPVFMKKNELPEGLKLSTKTQNPQLKKDLLIEVKWTESINYFVYIVVGRGNIITAERVEVSTNSQSKLIKIKPTLEMIPQAGISVHYIYNGNIRFEEITIDFEEDFQNTLQISTTAKARPGDDVEIQITTDPNSYVGLLGIDQSILHFGNDHDFKKHNIFDEYDSRYSYERSKLVSLSNAHFPMPEKNFYTLVPQSREKERFPVPRERFPETWMFENFNVTNRTEFSFVRKIPDTITSWVITGFSMNSNTGFALTKKPTKIQVFKPFFISIDLPYSVKQGEIITILVSVFNYMNRVVNTEVTMDNSDNEFDFVEDTNENDERSVNKPKALKSISVASKSAESVSFMIKPKIVGILTLKVTAHSPLAGDIVHKKLKVEPEGVTQYQNRAFFINLNGKKEQTETITLDIPANVVPSSEHIEFSAIGDIIGISLKYIENLVRMPVGLGEQNMINFVPSILALKYLQIVDRQMPNVTKTARKVLKIGFQREQNFRYGTGSYSAYGISDRSEIGVFEGDSDRSKAMTGSTWLTAYVIRYFQQASEFINIDQEAIDQSLRWLVSKQTTNGNFAEFGHLLEFPHLTDVSLSAFVLLTFLENKENFSKYESSIKKGIEFLIRSLDEKDDIYSMSITALVLQKANHPLADEVLSKLMSISKNENGLTWWSIEAKKQKRQTSRVYKSTDIEITSYILLAMLEKGSTENVLPIIKWLTMQRNSNGGFTSTQDTVVGLQALIKFVEKTGISRTGSMDIEYISEGNGVKDKGTITIIPENLMMLNTHELPKNTRKVAFTAKGTTSSLVQLSYSYNTIDKGPEQSFRLNVNVRENTAPNVLIDICAEFVPINTDTEEKKTNMIAIEVDLPSGYTTGSEDLQKIRDFRTILFTETKKSDTVAIIYLHSLEVGNQKCFSIGATKIHKVSKQKPVPVVIYDYYDKELRATEYYEVKSMKTKG